MSNAAIAFAVATLAAFIYWLSRSFDATEIAAILLAMIFAAKHH